MKSTTSKRSKIARVAVIGFGSAGATAALCLRRSGFHVEIFEQAEKIAPIGAGILLHPSGQLILERLALLEEVATQSEKIETIFVRSTSGRTLVNARYDWNVPGRCAYGVERTLLFSVFEQAARKAEIPIQLSAEVTRLEQEGGGTRCRMKSGALSEPFDLVLLTDGARSRLRRTVVRKQWTWNYSHSAFWVIGRQTQAKGKLFQFVEGTKRLVGILPTGRDRASFFWGVAPGDNFHTFAEWKAEALRICPLAEELVHPLSTFDDLIQARYQHVFCSLPVQENVVLLGDAWHAMSPHFGQGTNLAMLDGYLFSKLLESKDGNLSEMMPEFLQRRRANNRVYSTLSLCLSPFFQSNGIAKGLLRDMFLPLLPHLPWMKRQMASVIGGLKPGFFSTKDLEV